VNQDQRDPRVLGASRSLRVKKLESGGQLRRGGRSLRRRRSAEGSVSLSKRPGVYGRRRPVRDRRWLRGRSRALGQRDRPARAGLSRACDRCGGARGQRYPSRRKTRCRGSPRAAAQRLQSCRKTGKAQARERWPIPAVKRLVVAPNQSRPEGKMGRFRWRSSTRTAETAPSVLFDPLACVPRAQALSQPKPPPFKNLQTALARSLFP
jgi:hypothetical protein